jgi:hypothetical protein
MFLRAQSMLTYRSSTEGCTVAQFPMAKGLGGFASQFLTHTCRSPAVATVYHVLRSLLMPSVAVYVAESTL